MTDSHGKTKQEDPDPLPASRDVGASRPLLPNALAIAHRGFSWIAPENTIASYERALAAGARLFECDVWLSADGVPVVFHDEDLQRVTGVSARVHELPAEELTRLDAGRWKDESFAGEGIPTLSDLLTWTGERSTPSAALGLVIEIKQSGMAAAVLETIRATNTALETVTILAFDLVNLTNLLQLESRLRCIWLQDDLPDNPADRQTVVERASSSGVSGLGTSVEQFDPEFVELAHASGFSIYVWTANEVEVMRRILRGGVDAVISDRPDLLLEVLDENSC